MLIKPLSILFGNMGPLAGYRVTASEESAPVYAVLAGFFIGLALFISGYRIVRRSRFQKSGTRLVLFLIAGCVSIGWFSLWIFQHAGSDNLIPVEGIWNFAVQLPTVWFWAFCILLLIGVSRFPIWLADRIDRINESNPRANESPKDSDQIPM